MKNLVVLIVLFMTGGVHAQSVKKHVHKNQLYQGISFAYLPTWLLDDYRGNKPSTVYFATLHGHQEIWKESVLEFGVGRSKIFGSEVDEHSGIILPIKLRKFFVPERKGFNLSAGMSFNFCQTCRETFDGAFTNEMSYLFAGQSISINAGLQIIAGALFQDIAVHVGVGVEVLYRLYR